MKLLALLPFKRSKSNMKRSLVLVLLTFTLCAIQLGVVRATTPTCHASTFSSLQYNVNVTLCKNKAGVDVTALSAQPTNDQLNAFCETNFCMGLLNTIVAMHISECVVPINSGMLLVAQIINPIVLYCQAHNAQEGASGSSSSSINTSTNSSTANNSSSKTTNDTKSAAMIRPFLLCVLIILASIFLSF